MILISTTLRSQNVQQDHDDGGIGKSFVAEVPEIFSLLGNAKPLIGNQKQAEGPRRNFITETDTSAQPDNGTTGRAA